jgi:hypothetical protein
MYLSVVTGRYFLCLVEVQDGGWIWNYVPIPMVLNDYNEDSITTTKIFIRQVENAFYSKIVCQVILTFAIRIKIKTIEGGVAWKTKQDKPFSLLHVFFVS